MIPDWSRDRYPAGRGDTLQSRGYIDTIAKDIVPLHNDIAYVNAHAGFDAVILRHTGVSFTDTALQLGGAGDRAHHARKLHQHAGAWHFDDSPLMRGHSRSHAIARQRV